MAVVVPFIGAAIGSAAFAGTALAAYGASIGWIAGSRLGGSTFALIGQRSAEPTHHLHHKEHHDHLERSS